MTTMNFALDFLRERQRAERAEGILKGVLDSPEFRRLTHMYDLERKNRVLKREVRAAQIALEDRNRTVAATNLVINCTGCDAGGPPDREAVTEEVVAEVERIARRLRTWLRNHQDRAARDAPEQAEPNIATS